MSYSLEIQDSIIIISFDPYGQYVTIAQLKEQVLHLMASYKVVDVRLDSISGESIDFKSLDSDKLTKLIQPKDYPKCPTCSTLMSVGQCYTKSTLKGFLVWGASYKELVFETPKGDIRTLIKNGVAKTAHRCHKCQLTLIRG